MHAEHEQHGEAAQAVERGVTAPRGQVRLRVPAAGLRAGGFLAAGLRAAGLAAGFAAALAAVLAGVLAGARAALRAGTALTAPARAKPPSPPPPFAASSFTASSSVSASSCRVGHRRVDAAVLHVRAVAARVQLDRLPVGGMLAQHAQRGRAALRPRAPLRSFASNSKPILPSGWRTRNAENGRLRARRHELQEIGLAARRAASASARARSAAAGSSGPSGSRTSCPRRPPSRTRTRCGVSNTRPSHFGHGPSGSWPVKSGASSPSPSPWPKSNCTSFASLSLSFAENGRPIRLRKPSSGPTSRSRDQRLGFRGLELAAAQDLPEAEVARRVDALELLVLLVHFAAALRARHASAWRSRRESCRSRSSSPAPTMCFVMSTISRMNVVALELAVLHLRELELPLGGELRARRAPGTPRPCSSVISENAFAVGDELLAFAVDVALDDQPFDDLRARRRRAEALLAHRLAQLVVLDQLARAFHRREQRAFVVARRRTRRELRRRRPSRVGDLLAGRDRHEVAVAGASPSSRFLAVDREPAGD